MVVVLSLVAGMCALMALASSAAAATPSRFNPRPCSALKVRFQGKVFAAGSQPGLENARCGYLVVPENRRHPTGRTIRLAVAIAPPVSRTPASDPVVFLGGGPGSGAIGQAAGLIHAGMNRDRELILVDQRGVAFSKPQLMCPESFRFVARRLGMVYDAASTGRRQAAATRACHRRLVGKGIDLGAYNTTENAADVADLRVALGIPRWNVYGVSYGSDVALTLMHEHPQGIRSVTLDSVVPPHLATLGNFWHNVRDGFQNVFAACAAQPRCQRRHPRLGRTFTRLVRRLEAHPVTTRVKLAPDAPRTKVVLDGGALSYWLVLMALGSPRYPPVPNWIDQLAHGHPQNIAKTYAIRSQAPINGLQYGVECSEWVPYESRQAFLAAGRRAFPRYPHSVIAQAPQLAFAFRDCRTWAVPKAPARQRAITRSSIPTLLMAGTFDAVTPPRPARFAARTLPNSTVVTFPGIGHDALGKSRCAQRVFSSFLGSPNAPDTRCAARVRPPRFR
jgi:pimeloyl-ACP methyl ester carboxylesterase